MVSDLGMQVHITKSPLESCMSAPAFCWILAAVMRADGRNAWLTKWPSRPCGCHRLTGYVVCSPGVQLLWRAPQEGSSIGELETKLVGPRIFLLFTAGPRRSE